MTVYTQVKAQRDGKNTKTFAPIVWNRLYILKKEV
jgi:hypothetical protein